MRGLFEDYYDGYDPMGNDKEMAKFEDEDTVVNDPTWGFRTKRWLKNRREGIRKGFSGKDYSSYDYGFGMKATGYEKTAWEDYNTTGEWKGYSYYEKSTIDYRYIEQMANIFSAQHNITVKIGKTWAIDLKTKTLEYNPTQLMFGTKANVVVSLLHEIGHLRYTTHMDDLKKVGMIKKYKEAFAVLNVFEDFRIDELMKQSYAGAEDIYEANVAVVNELAKKYVEKAERELNFTQGQVNCLFAYLEEYRRNKNLESLKSSLETFGEKMAEDAHLLELAEAVKDMTATDFNEKRTIIESVLKGQGNINFYYANIIFNAYGLPEKKMSERIKKAVDETKHAIPLTKKAGSTQEVLDILEAEVYPRIEDLMKERDKMNEAMAKMLGEAFAKFLACGMQESEQATGKSPLVRQSGDKHTLPKEWENGEYDALKESVDSAIKELIRKLRILKAKDLSPVWESNKKRGKLNIRSVYRYPAGRFDIFKKREIVNDRTRNFAFALMVDVSGSMRGERAISATRGAIILAEVFSYFEIPFEIIKFGSFADKIKQFDEPLKRGIKDKIGGITQANDGSTRLNYSLKATGIEKRPERNKYLIVISDGGVDDISGTKGTISRMIKNGVQPIGLEITDYGGVQLDGVMPPDRVKEINDPNTLPIELSLIHI